MKLIKILLPVLLVALLAIQNISHRHQIRSWKSTCADWKTAAESWEKVALSNEATVRDALRMMKKCRTEIEALESDLKFCDNSNARLIEELRKK